MEARELVKSASTHTLADDEASEADADDAPGDDEEAIWAPPVEEPPAPEGGQPGDAENPWRDEIVRTIFGDVGAIRRDFSCAIERKILLHGRLYVTERFLCFYSNLFGFEKKIKIPYSHVTCITKEYTAVFIPNAIAIITARKEYVFRSFWDRDDCFNMLKACHATYRAVVEPAGAHFEEGGPAKSQAVFEKEARAVPEKASEVTFEREGGTPPRSPDGEVTLERADEPRRPLVEVARAGSSSGRPLVSSGKPIMARASSSIVDTPEHARDAAEALKRHIAKTALGTVLAECVLGVDVEGFFAHFLADGCGFGLADFHRRQGDLEVSVIPWAAGAQPGTHDREVRFRRLLTQVGGLGPPSTRTTKIQQCAAFGAHGLVVSAVMSMEDIPYRDCFTIHERWLVLPEGSGVRAKFEMEVKWTKSTIFKRKIESSSVRDLKAYYEAYAKQARTYLARGGIAKAPAAAAPAPRREAPPAAPAPVGGNPLDRALPWCLVFGLLYLLLSQRASHNAIFAELAALRADVSALKGAN